MIIGLTLKNGSIVLYIIEYQLFLEIGIDNVHLFKNEFYGCNKILLFNNTLKYIQLPFTSLPRET